MNSFWAGKSFLSVRLIQLLLSANTRENKPILILTYKNLALDALLGSCQKFCKPGELVRVGGGSKSSTMADCNLTNLLRSDKRFSSDEKMNRDMLQNLETRCEEALIELYECQSLSIETIISNPLFRGFLHKRLFRKGRNVGEMQITVDEDKMTKEFSKRLREWMPRHNVFCAVQACLSSIQKLQQCQRCQWIRKGKPLEMMKMTKILRILLMKSTTKKSQESVRSFLTISWLSQTFTRKKPCNGFHWLMYVLKWRIQNSLCDDKHAEFLSFYCSLMQLGILGFLRQTHGSSQKNSDVCWCSW